MALQTTTEIFIGGNSIRAYKEFTITQKIGQHHRFELVCRMDVLENHFEDISAQSKDFLGEIITFKVAPLSSFISYNEFEFKGVVTSINNVRGGQYESGDLIIISGWSTCIISDDGPHYASYNDSGLDQILEKTFNGYDKAKLKIKINPHKKEPLHYSVQQNESSYQYAARLASQYGEWFYYDGKQLIFGKPENKDEVLLTYGQDLKYFSMNLEPLPNNFKYFTNDYLTDQNHEKKTTDIETGVNGYNGFTSKKSETLYAKETSVFVTAYNDPQLKQRFDTQVELQKKATEINQVIVEGKSSNPGVHIGQIVKLKNGNGSFGSYRVIEVQHSNNENGRYFNTFKALTADMDIYPKTNLSAYPHSETQTAIVMENSDPDGLARVRVQFPWQKPLGTMTPWIRVATPHGGGDKGFHFIPEKGEEVLVGFEGGNAERPFMMGSMYHGSAGAGLFKSMANNLKSIRTRSGHMIEMNDLLGAETITITDRNQNQIHIDTANNNITITALENMTLNAKNFELNVEEDATLNIGQNTMIYTEKNLDVSSQNYTNTVEEKMNTSVGGELIQNSGNAKIQSKEDMKIACGATASFQGGGNVKISKG